MSGFGDILQTARRARGLTQEDVAARANVTQAALSRYENGMRDPEDEVLNRLAEALGVTETFLRHASKVRGSIAVDAHMRRRHTEKAKVWRKIEARLNMYRMHASLLFEEVSLRADHRVPTLDPIDTPPRDAARMVRMQWHMPIGPVRNLVKWLESAGCIVIEEDFDTSRVDGMSQWVGDHPVILVNLTAPTDRKRMTMAHELGHLVLHNTDATEDMEVQANEFAAEFLMPSVVIRPQLRRLSLGRLHDLKREWGVSMQALMEAAYRLDLINGEQRTRLYKSLSSQGWRTREPVSDELPPETPSLTRDIGAALASKGLNASDVAQLAGFASPSENDLFPVRAQRLKVV